MIATEAQTKRIKKHLEDGGSLTQFEALKMFGTMRLASRINDLKNEGMNISKVMEEHNGKRYARYFKTVEEKREK